MDGDGYPDVLVGANQYANGQEKDGRAYLDVQNIVTLHFHDSNQPSQGPGITCTCQRYLGHPPRHGSAAAPMCDIDAGTPGVQWIDSFTPLSPGEVRYYQVKAYNSFCDAEGPP